jgi:hypothetical protein
MATLITPSGWGNWQAVLNNNSRYILSRTVETMPPAFYQPGTWPFVCMLALTIVLIAARSIKSVTHVVLLAGFAILSLLMARNIPLFVIATAPIMSESVNNLSGHIKWWQTIEANTTIIEGLHNSIIWSLIFGVALALFVGSNYQIQKKALMRFNERVFPVAAVDWLAGHPQPGNMFNEFNWGGYLLYRLWPNQTVFLDSQTDFYGEALVREYEQILTAKGEWMHLLDRYAVKWAILPRHAPLVAALQSLTWQALYSDQTTIILRRP